MVLRKENVHGKILKRKSINPDIKKIYQRYLKYLENISKIKILDEQAVGMAVSEFNDYRNDVLYELEARKNSGQESLRSTMLEEFFCHLFEDLIESILVSIPPNLFIGKANSYVDLTFSPSSFKGIFSSPNPYIHSKDQDFVVGAKLDLIINPDKGNERKHEIIIPVVAIECKTYLERNMFDSCSGTARRLKNAMPYCMYIVAAEYMKLKDEQPELSDINEIYILCKASVSERNKLNKAKIAPHKIDSDLILDLFQKVKGHFNSIWWDPDKALVTGKIINRP